MTLIYGYDPIVWKMFINNFSHLSIFIGKYFGAKCQQHENNTSLIGKSNGSMFWIGISCKLVVHIIIFEGINKLLNQDSIDIKSAEKVNGVIFRVSFYFSFKVIGITCCLYQLADFISIIATVLTLIPNVANYQSFSGYCRYQSILENKHHPVKIENFY